MQAKAQAIGRFSLSILPVDAHPPGREPAQRKYQGKGEARPKLSIVDIGRSTEQKPSPTGREDYADFAEMAGDNCVIGGGVRVALTVGTAENTGARVGSLRFAPTTGNNQR